MGESFIDSVNLGKRWRLEATGQSALRGLSLAWWLNGLEGIREFAEVQQLATVAEVFPSGSVARPLENGVLRAKFYGPTGQ